MTQEHNPSAAGASPEPSPTKIKASSPVKTTMQDQEWIDLYSPFLTVGSLWRSDQDAARRCRVTEISPRYVEAFHVRFNDDGKQLVRSHGDTFRCSIGIFLRSFSPSEQVITARVASTENSRVALAAQREAIQLCKQAVAWRLNGLVSALQSEQSEESELVQRINDILITEIDQQASTALASWQPPKPQLVEKPKDADG